MCINGSKIATFMHFYYDFISQLMQLFFGGSRNTNDLLVAVAKAAGLGLQRLEQNSDEIPVYCLLPSTARSFFYIILGSFCPCAIPYAPSFPPPPPLL